MGRCVMGACAGAVRRGNGMTVRKIDPNAGGEGNGREILRSLGACEGTGFPDDRQQRER